MSSVKILWADDEIDLLRPQIIFLESKGYTVIPVTNGQDAIDKCKEVDIVFLDESMPGLSGLETLTKIKAIKNQLPVVMITKNEEENLMEDAIGSQITDYLIKPVKPQQILLTLKKIIDNERLVSDKTTSSYQQDFQKIFSLLQTSEDFSDWSELYRKLIYWELEISKSGGQMEEVLTMQKKEANVEFCKFVIKNYIKWLNQPDDKTSPVMSYNLMAKKIFPVVSDAKPTFVILIDNLRFDQWKMIEPLVAKLFNVTKEDTFYSILPTATQYSRNAIFSGMMPIDIEKKFPDLWKNDAEEGGKNMSEEVFFDDQVKRTFHKETKHSYLKITNHHDAKKLEDNILNMMTNQLNVIVYNFVDMLSHARTEMEVLKELASDERAYRSLTYSWFEHSPLYDALKRIAVKNINLIITTDHGTIRVQEPSKVIGDKNTTTNIRYKNGKNLQYNPKEVFEIRDPKFVKLPSPNVSTSYIFAKEDKFFAYPNNYNHYVNYFKNTFQHGGVSLEEMIVPVIYCTSK